jgi:Family of unknown function (DUF6237)
MTPPTAAATGWDQATYRCGRCGAERVATTEEAYIQAVSAHRDAHAVWDRLVPVEREGFASILRVILSAPELGAEFLSLAESQKPAGQGCLAADPDPVGTARSVNEQQQT